jgi:hypothetical protein
MKRQLAITGTMIATLGLMLQVAQAQVLQTNSFNKKDMTLTLSGSGSSSDDLDTNVGSFDVGLEYFIADALSASLRQGVSFSDDETRDSDVDASTRFALDLYLGERAIVPFIGANIGYLYGDSVKDTFIAGPEVGFRLFITEDAFINFLVEYQFLFDDADEVDENYDDGRFVYSLGFGVRFD